MTDIDGNVYNHRHSTRLKGYDYSQAGLYYITICVQDRKCLFGEIVDGIQKFEPLQHQPLTELNDAGKIADECWLEIPKHFPNVVLLEYIIMPNHVHGIIQLKRVDADRVGTRHVVSPPYNSGLSVGTSPVMALQQRYNISL